MYPRSFGYYKAHSVEDALSFLNSHEGSKIIAGGQSLVPMMKLRLASPSSLVDINGLAELRYIREIGEAIHVGALTTHSDIEDSDLIAKKAQILSLTAKNIGDVQIRSLGTIGGSICHADPSADYFPTLLVLGASVVVRSTGGARRSVPVGEFVEGPFETVVGENEILEEVVVPLTTGTGGVSKFARRKADFALVSVAAIVDFEKSGAVKGARIAIGPQEKSATRLPKVERALLNGRFENASQLEKAISSGLAKESLAFPGDLHGSSWYRGEVLQTVLARTLNDIFEKRRSRGGAERW